MSEDVNADELADGLTELVRIFEGLQTWQSLPWGEVQEMAQAVGPIILSQLVGRSLWDGLTPAEQAAVHWAMADGYIVSGVGDAWVCPEREGSRIASLCVAADRFAVKCGARRYLRTNGELSSAQGAEYAARFAALPEGWRAEAMRRAATSGDIVQEVSSAASTINVLRSVYGISVPRPRT